MPNFAKASSIYCTYTKEPFHEMRRAEVAATREELMDDLTESPDYQADALRNGNPQPMVFTRGGEDHGYNVICLPGDELYAGDIIDAFGEKWIVMRARADTTTHRVGVMYQCNKLLRFQNFDGTIHERWSYIDVSGYSSAFNNSTSMQSSGEQMVIYLPMDEETAKIYVDKRFALNTGIDRFGRRMLSVLRVTGANPVAESFNKGDHILMLKVERDLYNEESDNVDLEICDYIREGGSTQKPDETKLPCSIEGRTTLRLGKSGKYKAVFTQADETVAAPKACWTVTAEPGIEWVQAGNDLILSAPKDEALIGGSIILELTDEDGRYDAARFEVEVVSLV